ncbi:MAG TPA: hypothetical protein VJP79_00425 [Nitrososphaera sp.]|nr:hypothetical protein [Nitrososphaera sp.]
MALRLKQRRGIGNVITTLIILIASVVLGAGVIFFGGSLFQTNTENEAIQVSNAHIWISTNGTSVAGFVVQNTGGKAVSIESIEVRGMTVPMGSWYYNTVNASAANIQKELQSDYTLSAIDVTGAAPEEAFVHATGKVSLPQGQAVIMYVSNPAGITTLDAGFDYNLNVHAGKSSASIAAVHAVVG